MMDLGALRNFFPEPLRNDAVHTRHLLKESIQLMVLDDLSVSPFARDVVFIGGTNLRLIKGIDRFSEDLDFDCRAMSRDAFMSMTDASIAFLRRNGLHAEPNDVENSRLKAFRRNIHFPGLLQRLGLSGHRDERFLLKIECQDQHYRYTPTTAFIKGCGYAFPFPAPPDPILCAMKLSALLSRSKGRDFYDAMFLLQQTEPDYGFLAEKCGIHNLTELQAATVRLLEQVDLSVKRRDFEHLLFARENSRRILHFAAFMQSL